ncbi:transporter substrate-binding domain-containing protein [Pseudomonas sp. NPDC089734]|uniref:transporter substrate-binding domain-containing protein n=1 Tax=Pseudomonas sp. NPDC089734 TaxID=3364469 RepID=UPI0037F6E8E7
MFKRHALLILGIASFGLSVAYADQMPSHITIATEGAYAPWNFTKPDGSLDGYEVDLTKALCERMQVKCDLVSQEWKGIIPGLALGKYDAIIAGMGVTEERKKVVAFSKPYAKSPNGFLTSKDSDLAGLPDAGKEFDLNTDKASAEAELEAIRSRLAGKVIGVQTGATAAYFVKQYFKNEIVREYPSFEQLGLELSAGRIDVAVASVTAFKAVLDSHPDGSLVSAGPSFKGGVLGLGTVNVALRPTDDALRNAMNTAIDSLNADGTNKALAEKWFGVDISIK